MNPNVASREKTYRLPVAGLLVVVLSAAGPAAATPPFLNHLPVVVAREGGSSDGGVSLDEAVEQVRRQTRGRILSADTVREDGRWVHRIKVLTDEGRVRRLRLDAGSGGPVRPRR